MRRELQWESRPLGDWAERITVGHVGSMAHRYTAEGVPFLRSLNIKPYHVSIDDLKFIPSDFHVELSKSALSPGDVVIVRTGMPGTAAVIPDWLPEANCSDLVIVRPSPGLDARFLVYFLNSPHGRRLIQSRYVGSVQSHFNVRAARSLPVAFPPLREQRRIAAVLGALDDKIELNRQMNRTLEDMAQAIFKSWFVDFDPIDGGIPADWRRRPLGEVVESVGGGIQTGPFGSQLKKREYVDEGIPVIMPKQLKDDRVSTDDIARITEKKAQDLARHRLGVGDIVLSRRGDVERRALVTKREVGWLCGTGCLKIQDFAEGLEPQFLYWYLGHPSVASWLVRHAQGATMPNLNTKILSALPLCVPPGSLIRELATQLGSLFARREYNYDASQTLAELRDTLLPKLISGELRVPEAEAMITMEAVL